MRPYFFLLSSTWRVRNIAAAANFNNNNNNDDDSIVSSEKAFIAIVI